MVGYPATMSLPSSPSRRPGPRPLVKLVDTPRLILIVALGLVSFMLWEAWQRDYGGVTPAATGAEGTGIGLTEDDPDIPQIKSEDAGTSAFFDEDGSAGRGEELITLETDALRLKINRGGTIVFAELLNYPVSLDKEDQPVILLDQSATLFHVMHSGLVGDTAPTHKNTFSSSRSFYSLEEDENALRVPLTWTSGEGVSVTKVFELERDSYQLKLSHIVENNSSSDWQGRQYTQIKRDEPSKQGRRMIYTYTGAVLSSPDNRYEKISFGDMDDAEVDVDIVNGWAAMIQHYFLTAVIPVDKEAAYRYYTRAFSDQLYAIGSVSPELRLPPGQQGELSSYLYVGPKNQAELAKVADGLELTVDYGILWFLAKPLFWCLERLFGLTGNWGWSIILVTILLKILFYHLSAAGYRSMAKMRRLQPRLVSLRDRYKEDRARLNQAMMQLYKEEKINPLGGCFPILIQLPVFLALYWVLLESVELRQADFILWLNDLSSKDPYFVLPVIMGITMLVQQKLNPAPMDPLQEKVLKMLPFIFTIFFAFFPSGLVLYWVTNNILSIAQQWLITRNLEKEGLGASASK